METKKTTTKKISELRYPPYGYYITETQPVVADPSREDIETAVKSRQLEERGFQNSLQALLSEWAEGLSLPADLDEYGRRCRIYHARRIAYFVVNGWDGEAIELAPDGVSVTDGLHRLRAAIFNRQEEVEVKVAGETSSGKSHDSQASG
jgi:hypothetical protein